MDREFVAGFDWFHHSESYTYIYYLGLADPEHYIDRNRALRYARMYTGDDPLAPNWDAEQRLIRGPLNGSRGPRHPTTKADWDYHRPILSGYLAPYEDIEAPGVDKTDPLFRLDWTDDETYDRILTQINERMTRCDVPLNMSAASLVTNAFLYTGEEHYRQWVLDYLQAWVERLAAVAQRRERGPRAIPHIGPVQPFGRQRTADAEYAQAAGGQLVAPQPVAEQLGG
ncbi:MAG TPA: hypothetical protein EYQ31_05595, partial [Candidatus Handelsmanbacteria bacterium]|nr:hypothetical protein [Candidatus Handelsmanbacteria bacterium]